MASGQHITRCNKLTIAFLLLSLTMFDSCQDLVPRDVQSVLFSGFRRSEIFGFLAGLGTTFAALPDLLRMFKRRSHLGMNPMMATIMGAFQIFWIYYGLLIDSRPVILWNLVAVFVNSITVGAYYYFAHKVKID